MGMWIASYWGSNEGVLANHGRRRGTIANSSCMHTNNMKIPYLSIDIIINEIRGYSGLYYEVFS
jgi:hypothetical protein